MVTWFSAGLCKESPELVSMTKLHVLVDEGEDLEKSFAIDELVELVEGVGDVGSLLHNRLSDPPPLDFLCPGSLYCMVLCLQFLTGGFGGLLHS